MATGNAEVTSIPPANHRQNAARSRSLHISLAPSFLGLQAKSSQDDNPNIERSLVSDSVENADAPHNASARLVQQRDHSEKHVGKVTVQPDTAFAS